MELAASSFRFPGKRGKYMKKTILILMALLLSLGLLAGCGGDASGEGSTVDELIAQQEQEAKHDSQFYANTDLTEEEEMSSSGKTYSGIMEYDPADIDLDLTTMSATMVYSEVSSMIASPEDYVGLIVKMDGTSASYYDDTTNKTYYACIIKDATACCAQGIEYDLMEEYGKDAYPADEGFVSVIGEFSTYEEEGQPYITLKNAQLVQ